MALSEEPKNLEISHHENVEAGDEQLKESDKNQVLANDTELARLSRWQTIKHLWWPALLCMMACLGCVNDGYQNQLPGSLISNQGFINQFGKVVAADGTLSLSPGAVSLWSAMMPVGQIPGSVFAGWVNDMFGRRGGMYLFTTLFIVGTITESVATTSSQWAGAKFAFGFAQGLTTATVPLYVGEIAPPQIRGTLLCAYGFMFAIGQLFASVVLYVVQNVRPLDWRVAVYTEWAFHGTWILFGLIWLPETPWYYARKELDDKALASLNRIYKGVQDFNVEHEFNAIKYEIERQQAAASVVSAWTDLFKGPNAKRTLAASLAISTQMLAGGIVIFNYTTYFVQQAGIGQPFLASMIVTIILLVGLILSLFAVELFGRRTLMITGGVVCTICNVIIGVMGCITRTQAVNNTALAFVFLWVFSYAMSFAGVSWALVSECATPRLKSKTAAFATMTYDVWVLVFTVSAPYMLATSGTGARNWGLKTLFMFVITCGAATVGNYFLCPETKRRTQNELDEMYERGIPARQHSKYVSELEKAGGKRSK